MVRALLASHVRLYREGLADVLERIAEIEVVGQAGDRVETEAQVRTLAPDVLVLDTGMPESLAVLRELASAFPDVRTVALALPDRETEFITYAEAGAQALLTVGQSVEELVASIVSAARGETLCSPRVATALIRRVAVLAAERGPVAPTPRLTRREAEIVELLALGLSNKEIARSLCISLPTAKNHVHHILEKLDVHSRADAVARAGRRVAAA